MEPKNLHGFASDRPIITIEEDELDRSKFASELAYAMASNYSFIFLKPKPHLLPHALQMTGVYAHRLDVADRVVSNLALNDQG